MTSSEPNQTAIKAKGISQKIKRYQDRTEKCRQNRIFQTNQKRLFEKLERQVFFHRSHSTGQNSGHRATDK